MNFGARLGRLYDSWVYGGTLAGCLLLLLLPVLTAGWPVRDVLVLALLPVYMLHQYEEHDADRFREFVNDRIGHGREVLTIRDVFVINIFGVWVLMGATVVAARTIDPGFGVVAVYLVLVNAVLHAGQGVALRVYNPGLLTAVVLFLPLGIVTWMALGPAVSPAMHAFGLVVAVGVHAAIVLHVRRRLSAASLPTTVQAGPMPR